MHLYTHICIYIHTYLFSYLYVFIIAGPSSHHELTKEPTRKITWIGQQGGNWGRGGVTPRDRVTGKLVSNNVESFRLLVLGGGKAGVALVLYVANNEHPIRGDELPPCRRSRSSWNQPEFSAASRVCRTFRCKHCACLSGSLGCCFV